MRVFEYNIDKAQIDDIINKKEDAFSHELIIRTESYVIKDAFHFTAKDGYNYFRNHDRDYYLPEGKQMFEIQYKSTPNGEELSIDPMQKGVDKLIININGNANITLKKYGYADDCFLISRRDFIKCCEAKTLRFQLSKGNDIVYEDTTSRDDLILYFQALYHEVIDDTKYQEAKETLNIKCQNELNAYKEWNETNMRKFWEEMESEKTKEKERELLAWGLGLGIPILIMIFALLSIL